MCKAMRELMADERAEGRAEGSGDIVLEFLRELGALSEELIARIRQERDLQVLRAWAKLAARAGSVQEFEMEM